MDDVDLEHAALLGDSLSLALMVVLDAVPPAERIAFVLHDMFGVPFDQIAGIVGQSPVIIRQHAGRARGRVRSATPCADRDSPSPAAGSRPSTSSPRRAGWPIWTAD